MARPTVRGTTEGDFVGRLRGLRPHETWQAAARYEAERARLHRRAELLEFKLDLLDVQRRIVEVARLARAQGLV